MYCIRCGRQVQAEAAYCWNCGATIGTPPAGFIPVPSGPAAEPSAAPGAGDVVLPAAVPGVPPGAGWHPFDPSNPPAAPDTVPAGAVAADAWAPPRETAAAAPPAEWPAPGEVSAGMKAGGFWRRVFAWCIDAIVLNILNMPFALLWVSPHYEMLSSPDLTPEQLATLVGGYALAGTTGFLLSWAYQAGLECSVTQATLGKMALGVKVCDGQYRRVSFARASGRFLAKIPSNLTLGVGYLMAAFTARKRALHDMIAGTLVIRG